MICVGWGKKLKIHDWVICLKSQFIIILQYMQEKYQHMMFSDKKITIKEATMQKEHF